MPEESGRLRLTQSRRIKLGRDFARARAEGQRVVVGCLIANWVPLSSDSPSRVGLITSRKIGGAVARARARRLLRETFRLHQHDFERPIDLVLIARNSIVGKKLAGVEVDFLEAMRRARLLKKPK
ncbi:MAG: ribonuclease P protein component [Verrucomicrobia bacterium]|nr:ribonuclease P protein component [Verrucomicrobiota bacterium]